MTTDLTKGYYHILNGENGFGKTHYLSQLSQEILDSFISDFDNMICLSGIAFDRFPYYTKFKDKYYIEKEILIKYCYFGYTTTNNMSTEIIPFRTIFDIAALKYQNDISGFIYRIEKILTFLNTELGFEEKIEIQTGVSSTKKFKDNITIEKTEIIKSVEKLINVLNTETEVQKETKKKTETTFNRGDIKDITFFKNGEEYTLIKDNAKKKLSSGQYQFIRCIFALILTITPNSLVIYDEPETSLHPEWQSKFIQLLIDIIKEFGTDDTKQATVVIATHSPLITASFAVQNVKIANKQEQSNDFNWVDYHYYGWDTNNLLKEHFGLESARSADFVEDVNNLLKLFQESKDTELKTEYEKFEKLLWDSHANCFRLSINDPLYGTLEALKAYVETIK